MVITNRGKEKRVVTGLIGCKRKARAEQINERKLSINQADDSKKEIFLLSLLSCTWYKLLLFALLGRIILICFPPVYTHTLAHLMLKYSSRHLTKTSWSIPTYDRWIITKKRRRKKSHNFFFISYNIITLDFPYFKLFDSSL